MNVACCEDGCRGIPNDNVPLFVSHLILVTLSTASWILCAAVLKDDWPTHVESWLVFCKDQGATIKLSKGGEPLAPFVAWRKRAAKADAKK